MKRKLALLAVIGSLVAVMIGASAVAASAQEPPPRVNQIDQLSFCTDGSTFFFDATYSTTHEKFYFGIGSDGTLFASSDNARIDFVWDGYTRSYNQMLWMTGSGEKGGVPFQT